MRNYLTLRQAAVLSGLSPTLVYELCLIGLVRAKTVRGRWRVDAGDFTAWTGGRGVL